MPFSIHAWVDGSAYWRTEQGGWCSILAAMRDDATEQEIADAIYTASECLPPDRADITLYDDDEKMKAKISVLRGYAVGTTNNRMEMHAIIASIEAMTKPCAMKIVSDSEFAIGAFTTWNVKANKDLIDRYRKSSTGFKIIFEHVDGHSGHPLNEWADKLASYKGNPDLEV